MISRRAIGQQPVALALVGAIGFFVAAGVSAFSVRPGSGLASVWLADGALLGLLIARTRTLRDVAAIAAGGFVASFASCMVRGYPAGLSATFATANIIEVTAALALFRWADARPGPLARVSDVMTLLIACAGAPLFSASISAVAFHLSRGLPPPAVFITWYLSAVLGLALATPAMVVTLDLGDVLRRYPLRGWRVVEVGAVLALVAGAAVFVFCLARHSAMFLLMPVSLVATFRLRQFGAVAATGLIAIVAAIATDHGMGPIAMGTGLALSGQTVYLQIFLVALFLSSLPVAAALAERDARTEEAHVIADHFRTVVETIDEVIFRTDRHGCWTYLNPAWERVSGYAVADSLGSSWRAAVDPADRSEVGEWLRPVLAGEVSATRRLVRLRTRAGEARWMELAVNVLRDQDGKVAGLTGTVRDVHDRKRLEERVLTAKRLAEERERAAVLLAATDELTGLPNRRAFLSHLERLIAAADAAPAGEAQPLAVAIFDVDHFKAVNDRHGHAVGDRVLEGIAARALGVVRGGDVVGRLGGEEFAIVMARATLADALVVVERLRAAVHDGDPDGILPTVTVSVGLAAHAPGVDSTALLSEADAALYAAKNAGRNRTRIAA